MTTEPKKSWVVFGATSLVAMVLFALWAQLTPLGSAPDEASHLVKSAAVIRGQPKGEEIPGWRLSIDGWAYESTSGVADIVVIADGAESGN